MSRRLSRATLAAVLAVGCVKGADLPAPSQPLLATSRADFPPRPAPAPDLRAWEVPALVSFALDNGLTVFALSRPGGETIAVRYVAALGGAARSLAEVGLASLVTSLMGHAASMRGQQLALTAAGTREPVLAFTDRYASHVVTRASADTLSPMLAELRAALECAELPLEAVAAAGNEQLDALHELLFDQQTLAQLHARQILFGDDHPLAQPTIGTRENLARVTVGDVRTLTQQIFAPETSALVLVGDVPLENIEQLVREHFASLPRAGSRVPQLPPRRPSQKRARGLLTTGRVAHIVEAFSAPAPDSPDHVPFQVLSLIAGELYSSRLMRALREEGEHTYQVSASYELGRDESTWRIETEIEPRTLFDVLSRIDTELTKLRTSPISAAELALAKLQARERFRAQLEDDAAASRSIAKLFALLGPRFRGDPRSVLREHAESIERVTAADLMRVAARYLAPAERATAVAGPLVDFEGELRDWYDGQVELFIPKKYLNGAD